MAAPARDPHLLTAVDQVIAAVNPAPLEALLSRVAIVGGVPIVELVEGMVPALPDDTFSWAALAELARRAGALLEAPFSRVSRQLGPGVVAVCCAWDDAARLVTVRLGDGEQFVLLVLDDGVGAPSAWRVAAPADTPRERLPEVLALVLALADRVRTQA